ncbi:hypothetical protein BC628DRAFT_1376288 [Trametes gibbosa]|nr:hypothetical protein BC628DRAFT_1376288 [Trametes gibbosa]
MQRMIGNTLEQLWRNLGLWGTLCAAWQLRGYLQLMRTVTAQTPGAGRTKSVWLDCVVPSATFPLLPSSVYSTGEWWIVVRNIALHVQSSFSSHLGSISLSTKILRRGTCPWIPVGRSGPSTRVSPGFTHRSSPSSMPWFRECTWAAWLDRFRCASFLWVAAGSFLRHQEVWNALAVVSTRTLRFSLDKTPFSGPL